MPKCTGEAKSNKCLAKTSNAGNDIAFNLLRGELVLSKYRPR